MTHIPTDPPLSLDTDSLTATATGALTLAHHVYSSVNGYRTLVASAQLKPMMPILEEWARRQCSSQSAVGWFSLPVARTHWMMSRVFAAGVDRAGRPRRCVHSVVFDRSTFHVEWPWFNPARIPVEVFLTPQANLDDADQLVAQMVKELAWSKAPELHDSAEAVSASYSEADNAVLRALFYSPRGVVWSPHDGLPGDDVVRWLDWMPLCYRLRWVVASQAIGDDAYPCQIVCGNEPPTTPLPLIAGGTPLRITPQPNPLELGLWDHWLDDSPPPLSASYRHWARFVSRLNLDRAPTPVEEHWLLTAFSCLRPYEPAAISAKDLNYQRTPQVALGLLCLGFANHEGAAMSRLTEFGQSLIHAQRFLTLTHLLEQLWSVTTAKPGARPNKGASSNSGVTPSLVKTVTQRIAAGPHGDVLQAVWVLLTSARSVGFAAYHAPDLPLADLHAPAVPWDADRRSLLWMNVVLLTSEAMTEFAKHASTLLTQRDHQDAALRLAGLLGTFVKFRALFAPTHQWLFNEIFLPNGPAALAVSVLERLRRDYAFPPDEIAALRAPLLPTSRA